MQDVDINQLCSEFASKAKCDGCQVVIEPSGMQENSWPGGTSERIRHLLCVWARIQRERVIAERTEPQVPDVGRSVRGGIFREGEGERKRKRKPVIPPIPSSAF